LTESPEKPAHGSAPPPDPSASLRGNASGSTSPVQGATSGPGAPVKPGGSDGLDEPVALDERGELEEDEGFLAEMPRLFMIPAGIVALCVGVFVLFGLIASEGKSAHDYVEEIRSARSNQRWQAAFELSRVLIRDSKSKQDPNIGPEVATLLGEFSGEEPLVRRYLVLALEEIGDPATSPALAGALADADTEVRLYAARALGRLKAPGAGASLLPLLEDEDPALRKMALHSLGRLGDPRAAESMRPRLEDPVEDVRWNAALALALLDDASGTETLSKMMDEAYLSRVEGILEDQKVEARINAVRAAWRLREPSLRAAVESLSRTDTNLRVRDVALKAIAEWP